MRALSFTNFTALMFSTASLQAQDRTVLPPIAPEFKGKTGETYKDSTPDFSPALPPTAPTDAPNVLIVLLDDVGFGQFGSYGGPIETPNIDKLAARGLRYNIFHTIALCSPSRAALLTGRNYQAISMAAITEAATGFPGNYGSIPKSAANVAETLKQNGYNTMAVGKWHLTPCTAYTAAGPFDRWPLGMGFERYYRFLGGETDQWAPLLIQDNTMIETPTRPGCHLTSDLVDRTVSYIRDQQQANTGRPFFTYLALGACHAPLHAPREYIAKYKGRFDAGWDRVREQTFERQKQLGIMPSHAKLPPANPGVPPWAELSEDQRKVYCRLQEVFAGFLDHADHELGRLFAALDEMGIADNTLIILTSDKGASQEGLRDGTLNTDRYRNDFPDTVEEMSKNLDAAGSAATETSGERKRKPTVSFRLTTVVTSALPTPRAPSPHKREMNTPTIRARPSCIHSPRHNCLESNTRLPRTSRFPRREPKECSPVPAVNSAAGACS